MQAVAIALGFLVSAAAVVAAGIQLTKHGDRIAGRTRLGGLWVGSVLLAFATSLPELATDVAAVRLGAIDLAAGDLFGSSMSNMLILGVVSLVPGTDLFRRAALDNGFPAALAIGLNAAAAVCVLIRPGASVFGVGVAPLILAFGYLVGVRAMFRGGAIETTPGPAGAPGPDPPESVAPESADAGLEPTLRSSVVGFVLAAAVILVTAPLFALSATALAEAAGLSTTFVGTWLVGFATSLPELVTTLTAVRMRAFDLAIGNLFGSNALNMALFLPLDLATPGGSIFADLSPAHAVSALLAVLLMAVGLAAIVRGVAGRLATATGALLMLLYGAGLWMVYVASLRA